MKEQTRPTSPERQLRAENTKLREFHEIQRTEILRLDAEVEELRRELAKKK